MKTQLQIVKDLIKKYPNDMKLGKAIRSMFTDDYWKKPKTKEEKSRWERELDKI
tara:strand:+ start:74 stop:235 length:162 start_codon:yes stop_codon:yes gene_type:complete